MKKLIFILIAVNVFANDSTLIVDVHQFKPMIIKKGSNFEGYDIDLLERLAADLNITNYKYNFVDDFELVITRLESHDANVSLGGLTITTEREEKIDFLHSYMRSGAGILILKNVGLWNVIIINIKFYAKLIFSLIPFILVWIIYVSCAALLIFALEKGNKDFNDKFGKGFPDARFFVHVVISSTGFGNQIPLSKWGRNVTVLLMYSGIGFMFPMITGKITTEMGEMKKSIIICKDDLKGKRVAVKAGTITSKSKTLQIIGAKLKCVKDLDEAFILLENMEVDAVVHDKPALEFIAKENGHVEIVDELFDIQEYGIALESGSELREQLNCLLLKYKKDGTLDDLAMKWLGHKQVQ